MNAESLIYPHDVVMHVSNDADVAYLVRTGLAWRSGPKTLAQIVTWLIGHPEVTLPDSTPEPLRTVITAGWAS